jgi:multidrug efflux pump subunit AcrA (membrane-fusion protein)
MHRGLSALKSSVLLLWLAAASCSSGDPTVVEAAIDSAPVFAAPAKDTEPRLKFDLTLTLDDPTDLRVQEGDRITKGQILAERQPTEQQRYDRARLQTQLTLVKPIPEEMQLAAATGELAAARYRLKDLPNTSPILDPQLRRTREYIKQETELQAEVAEKQAAISTLKAQIQAAKLVARQEKQQVRDQLAALDAEMNRLKSRSPYSGQVRRLKVERGTNNQIMAKLKIIGAP